jgi:hypothetical protein
MAIFGVKSLTFSVTLVSSSGLVSFATHWLGSQRDWTPDMYHSLSESAQGRKSPRGKLTPIIFHFAA